MPVYAYKGRSANGDLVQGTLEGTDSGAVADILFGTGITATDIKPSEKMRAEKKDVGDQKNLWKKLNEKPITPLDLMLFMALAGSVPMSE